MVYNEAARFTNWDPRIITAIAKAESGCNINATGDGSLTYSQNGRIYGYSVGALQVRILPGREQCDTHELTNNVDCANRIYSGQGYNAWTMYTNGRYKDYL
jgi:hypothetical protein